jgi:hypothetical protein
VTTPETNITNDMTPIEAAHLLTTLQEGNQAAWLSTREVSWQSAGYESWSQNATEIDSIFRDVMQETIANSMR